MRDMEYPSEPRIGASAVPMEIEDPSSILFDPAADRQSERAVVIKYDAHIPSLPTTEDPTIISERALDNKEVAQIPAVPTTTEDPTMLLLTEQAQSTGGCVDSLNVTKTEVQVTESEVPLSPENMAVKGEYPNKEDAQIPAVPTTTQDPTMLPPTEQAQLTGGCVDSLNVPKTEVQVTESEVPVSPENAAVKGEYPEVVDSKDPMSVDGHPAQGALDKPLESSISDIDDSKMKLPRYRCETLYIVDLHPSAVDKIDELSELFGQVGTLAKSISVIPAETLNQLNPGAGLARCSAYVTFNTFEEACRAWQLLNYHVWENVPMRIMFSNMDAAKRYNEKANIIVSNLEESIDSRTLHHHFRKFGMVISSKVQLDHMGRSTGRGLIQFQDEEDAQQAIRKMNNAMLRGNRVNVELFKRRTDPTESANLNPVQVQSNTNPTPIRSPTMAEIVKKNLIPEVSSNGSRKIDLGSSSGSAQVDAVGNTNYTKLRHFELQRGSSAQRNEARRKYKIEKNSKEMFETAPSIQASVPAPSSDPQGPPQPWSAEARRKYEKNRKEMVFGIAPSTQASVPAPSVQANVPAVPAPSSEPWPSQPCSAMTLKAMLAGANTNQKERTAMLLAILHPLVTKHTKEFVNAITNELVTTLSIRDIEGVLKMSEGDAEDALSERVEEVKLVIFDRIKKQPPFEPRSATSADDHPEPTHYPPYGTDDYTPYGTCYYDILRALKGRASNGTGSHHGSCGAFKDEVSTSSASEAPVESKEDDTTSEAPAPPTPEPQASSAYNSSSEAPAPPTPEPQASSAYNSSPEAPAPPTPEPQASSGYNLNEDDMLVDTDDEARDDEV